MPFRITTFQANLEERVPDPSKTVLLQACEDFAALTSPQQKLRSLRQMMELLDREVDEAVRWELMEACGRRCIGATTLKQARRLREEAGDLDDLLRRLNAAHIGGGHLHREGDSIHAAYDRCYCGSVSRARPPFPATYCHCSCGWYRQLFETLLDRPVEVALLGSIIQGADRCRFVIRWSESGRDASNHLR